MVTKADFTPEEWKQILEAPMLAGVAITAADPSGLWGLMSEGVAASGPLRDAMRQPSGNALIDALVADFKTADGRTAARDGLKAKLSGGDAAAAKDKAVAALAAVAALLDAKAPAEAAGFKAWLKSTSQRVAEASSEGGFIGFGGVKVSDAEKATLADIDEALGLA